jgi:uncharacterized cupin superfamily protein
MRDPIIAYGGRSQDDTNPPMAALGQSFDVQEWSGSGPDYLHVHHSDDEAWHVLEGTLTFKFLDRQTEAPAGTTVFVPAGVAHAYYEAHGPTRYLIIMTPRLRDLIGELHQAPFDQHNAIMHRYDSEIVD